MSVHNAGIMWMENGRSLGGELIRKFFIHSVVSLALVAGDLCFYEWKPRRVASMTNRLRVMEL